MGILSMAWRNLWRNQRRTLATVAATTLAVFVMIAYSGMMEGYIAVMEGKLLDMELGDIQIHPPGYLENPSLYERIDDAGALLARLDAAGFRAAPRLLGGGLAAAGDASAGVVLRGLDVPRESAVSRLHEAVGFGRWLDPADPKGVVLGWRLARTLEVGVGAEVLVLTQAADGSTANDVYLVRGVLKGIGDTIDRGAIFMNAAAFRDLLVVPDGVHEIILRKPPAAPLAAATASAHELAPGLDVQSWRELNPTLASYFDAILGIVYVFFFIIYIAIGIVILNAMLMAVFERIREFGILKALGMSPASVLALILTESGIIAALAVAAGALLAVPALYYLVAHGIPMGSVGGMSVMGLAMEQVWFARVTAGTFIAPVASLVIIITLAVLYPALKAASIQPVAAMRHHN